MRLLAAAVAAMALSACASLPKARTAHCEESRRPAIHLTDDGRIASTYVDVLTYNVEGLPRRIRQGRSVQLRQIGAHLAALRQAGQAPDIVLFQEVFSPAARRAVFAAGYPSTVSGPSATQLQPARVERGLPGRRNLRRGEAGLKFASSGLVITTEYPIVQAVSQAFARGSCAGLDCLANKGVMLAQIAIPGVPGTIDLFNTHMNSQRSSRAPESRHLAAHQRQMLQIAGFLMSEGDMESPIIFGGDFNMRHSEARFAEFRRRQALALVHNYCIENPEACEVLMSWDGDEPWMDTQDLQLFWSGEHVFIRPARVEAMFDGGPGGPQLSDHDGFRVRYELSWRVDGPLPPQICTPGSKLASPGRIPHMRHGSRADGALANPVRSGRKQP
jgi:endonuclease/exonuclease/phosphatase family metal-dependent hydrolase